MKKVKIILSWLLLIGILASLAWLFIKAFYWVRTLDAGVIAALVTAVAGFAGLLIAQWNSKSREISEGHRPNKIKVYELFFEIVQHFFDSAKSDTPEVNNLPDEIKEKFKQLNKGMIVWASPKVIRKWLAFKNHANLHKNSKELIYYVDDVLQAIRKDLGNSNFGLVRGDVVKLYLSNPSELE